MTINIVGTSSRWITLDFDDDFDVECQDMSSDSSTRKLPFKLHFAEYNVDQGSTKRPRWPWQLGVADQIFQVGHGGTHLGNSWETVIENMWTSNHSSDIWLWGKVPPRTIYIHLHHAFSMRFSFGDKNRGGSLVIPQKLQFSPVTNMWPWRKELWIWSGLVRKNKTESAGSLAKQTLVGGDLTILKNII